MHGGDGVREAGLVGVAGLGVTGAPPAEAGVPGAPPAEAGRTPPDFAFAPFHLAKKAFTSVDVGMAAKAG